MSDKIENNQDKNLVNINNVLKNTEGNSTSGEKSTVNETDFNAYSDKETVEDSTINDGNAFDNSNTMNNNNHQSIQPIKKDDNSALAIASFVLGIVGLFTMFIPFLGVPVTVVGLILGILSTNSQKRNLAITGIILSSVFLALTIAVTVMSVMAIGRFLSRFNQMIPR